MLSKQLLFRLATILFLVTVIGLLIFKVDTISVDVTKTSIQSRMEPLFFIEGISKKENIKYRVVDPAVKILDTGEVSIKSNLTLSSGLDQKWGSMELVSKVMFEKKNNSFYLAVSKPVELRISRKSSNDAGFKVWNKGTKELVADMTEKLNVFLLNKDIFALSGSKLRVQAVSLAINKVEKTSDGINIVLDVDQGIFIIIVYFAMFLSAFIFACGYFFVGGAVGFRDPTKMLFVDPKKIPKKEGK